MPMPATSLPSGRRRTGRERARPPGRPVGKRLVSAAFAPTLPRMHLRETFSGPSINRELHWRNPPPDYALTENGLTLATAAETDYWQRTHYGFRADNGHHLAAPLAGDFTLSAKVGWAPRHQYDQAGLLVWASAGCWLKTSVEFEPDQPSRLGAVATNHGWSDWSTQDLPSVQGAAWFRIVAKGADYTVYAATGDAAREQPVAWSQIRLAHLHDAGGTVQAGLYACSPKAAGFTATFAWLGIESV